MRRYLALLVMAALALLMPSAATEAEVAAVDGGAAAAQAAEPLRDTKKNRVRLAVRYLKEHPVEDMFDDMLTNYLSNTDPKQHEQMRAALDRVNTKKVHVAVRDALVRNLDVEELTFLVDMYSTELGKRVMKKMGKFMGEVSPVMQQEAYQALVDVTGGKIPGLPAEMQKPTPGFGGGIASGLSVPV